MKAIISTTFDDRYFYFLPITTWLWNKLNVDVICFMPLRSLPFNNGEKLNLIQETLNVIDAKCELKPFDAPEHKEATYAQCSRLYGACLDLPEDEVLIISDIDMGLFHLPTYNIEDGIEFTIFGYDLVPDKQYPMCYISANVRSWRTHFKLEGFSYQEKLDELLGHIECESFRGNYWGCDQETAYNNICPTAGIWFEPRARQGTQFATHRYDRDDAYILDRLSPDTIDFHFNRPGFEDRNFEIILTILKYHYPNDNFDWLVNYTNEYRKLL